MASRYSQTPEQKAALVKELNPLHYMSTVNSIIEDLQLSEPSGYGDFEEEIREQIREDIKYWKKVKAVLESPKDISYYNSIAY
jgi:hypothetical protein